MPAPGPPALGRGVVVGLGGAVPPAWAEAPVVVVDDAVVDEPALVVGRLHEHWLGRVPVVIELAVDPARFRAPVDHRIEPWRAGAEHECWHDRLHFLVWANTYDARADEPVWWWARKAARLGATETAGGHGDVTLADGTPAWIDGGPRSPIAVDGAAVVHAETVELGALTVVAPLVPSTADLAPDQLAAVGHTIGPARVIAPAGSGKTRVLTERLRHLLNDRGVEPAITLAVAYNKQAQLEMAARTAGIGARIQTLNALGLALVARWLGRRPDVLDERDVRSIVERLVPRKQRRANTDPLGPYLDGLSLIRLGLRDPEVVEESLDGVEGLAAAFDPYRDELRRRGALDFDEQVYLAVEALLHDGAFRRAMQAEHRHLLVDEFQDLTPAHVLMIRLLVTPVLDVYAVGDDDQTIYDHAGADPRFLIDHRRYFPGAGEHALEVNYRCPVGVIDAARHLLSYNDRRVPKQIRPGPQSDPSPDAVSVRLHPSEGGARELVSVVQAWLTGGADPVDVAVLARVNSLLLAPHVALAEAGVPLSSNLRPDVLERLGLRAALAYLRIAADPDAVQGADLVEVYRRPSRGLPNWIDKWLSKCRTVDGVSAAADRIDDDKVAGKLRQMHNDLHRLVHVARRGSTREVLVAVRDDIGLGSAMTLLDSGGGDGSSHLDDLEALLQVADLHPDPTTFEGWLRSTFHREADEDGVTLSTVHRVKGREWPYVAVFGVTEGIVPHRLAEDVEEERRVLHVAMTRGGRRLALLGDAARPSPFLGELDGSAPRDHVVQAAPVAAALAPASKQRAVAEPGVVAEQGLKLKVLGGYEGVVSHAEASGARLSLDDGRSLFVRYGERVEAAGQSLVLRSPFAAKAEELLRAWRSTRSKADGVPAFVVLSDKHLQGIAERAPATLAELAACPGIGPSKLDTYGEDILEVLAASAAALT